MSNNDDTADTTPTSDHSSKPAGEMIEDIVEGTITEASPSEPSDDDGGSEQASRDGHRASDGDAFNA